MYYSKLFKVKYILYLYDQYILMNQMKYLMIHICLIQHFAVEMHL